MTEQTIRSEAARLIRILAEPRPVGDSTKTAMARAWRRLPNWSWNRAKDVWKADSRIRIRAEELEQLRQLTANEQSKDEDDGVDAASLQLAKLRGRISRLEQLIAAAEAEIETIEIATAVGVPVSSAK